MRIERTPSRLDDVYDVAIIGGGITGVCVARETAGRGLRTIVIDKGDFGGGTSSATTKLLHGGIRYLETYQFAVVRESLKERRILSLAAPHLVRPTRFVMPAWSWSKPNAPLLGAGMVAYDALGFDKNRGAPQSLRFPRPSWLSKGALLQAVPWLEPSQLQGAFTYYDTLNIHPERLLLALLGSAVASGAVAVNHARATGFITVGTRDGVRVTGVEVHDELSGEDHTIRATTVVNAAGPWMDLVLESLGRPMGVAVQRSKGVHLLTRPLGGNDTVFARARSGRHVIVSPWMGKSFIGPTDTPITGDPDDVATESDDVELILDTVNATIGKASDRLERSDIEAVNVGIRPLIIEEGRDSYTTSRRHELYDHEPSGVSSLWSIGGGKWTTGRALGEEVAETLVKSRALAGIKTRRFSSEHQAVVTGFGWAIDAEPYLEQAARSRASVPLSHEVRMHLARLYGTDHERILDLVAAEPLLAARISNRPGCLDIAAQVVFAVTDESACTLADVIDRRLVLGTLGRVSAVEIAAVADTMGPLVGWDGAAIAAAAATEVARRFAIEARWAR